MFEKGDPETAPRVYGRRFENVLVIGNENLEISFDVATGGLKIIENKLSGTKYVKDHYVKTTGAGPILGLVFLENSTPITIYPGRLQDYEFTGFPNGKELVLRYDVKRVDATCRVRVEKGERLTFWSLHIENNSDKEVVEVVYPLLSGLCIGPDHGDDILIRPNRYGEKIANPVATPFDPVIKYLGTASMMWLDLYDPSGGLYLASYDKTLLMTDLEARVIHNGVKALTLSLKKYAYIPPDRVYDSEPYVVGIHPGDWHWAADRYREWAESWMQKPEPPNWLKECDGFLEFVREKFSEIPKLYETAESLGINYLSIAGQMVGDGCCDRFYYPDPLLGSIDQLKEAIREVHRRGGYMTFYTNGQALDPRYPTLPEKYNGKIPEDVPVPDWEKEYKSYALVRYDGSYVGQYPISQTSLGEEGRGRSDYPYAYYIMCPASEGWQNYLKYWILRYVKEYGADGMMMDQIGADDAKYCFNFKHGHRHHGAWVQGYCQMLKRIVEEGRGTNEGFALGWIEGCGDSLGQYGDCHLTHSSEHVVKGRGDPGWVRYPYPEVFRYTFPEYITFSGGPVEGLRNRKRVIDRQFLMGDRISVYYEEVVESSEYAEYVRKVVGLRKQIKSWLQTGLFRDTVGLEEVPNDVEAKIFETVDGEGLLITLLDDRRERNPFDLKVDIGEYNFREVGEVVWHTLKGARKLNYKVDNDLLIIKVGRPPTPRNLSTISAIIVSSLNAADLGSPCASAR